MFTLHTGTFRIYDCDGDGAITKEEMTEIVEAIYQLMGDRTVWAKVKICIFVVYVIKFFVIFLYFIEIELVLFCRM